MGFIDATCKLNVWGTHFCYIYIYIPEAVNVLYFGASTLQKKTKTPIKTGVIWVPGIYIYMYMICIKLYCL